MTLLELLKELQSALEAANKAPVEARWILSHLGKIDNLRFTTQLFEAVSPDVEQAARAMVALRTEGHPLQLLLGSTEFFGLTLQMQPGVLIPRPETEGLVEQAIVCLYGIAAPHVLDVGTGSGAIALAIKSVLPEATVWATDINPEALSLAQINARQLELDIYLEETAFTGHLSDFDLVVSNPPYLPESYSQIAPAELKYEDNRALYSGPEGLDMPRELLRHAWQALKPGGWLAMELSPLNVYKMLEYASIEGWHNAQVSRDLTQQPRYLVARKPTTEATLSEDELHTA
jgi:release factor glutamine methyltransferase